MTITAVVQFDLDIETDRPQTKEEAVALMEQHLSEFPAMHPEAEVVYYTLSSEEDETLDITIDA